MSPTLRERATGYVRDAATGIRRAPVEVIVTLAIALSFSTAVEIGDEAMRSWAEVAVAGALILAFAWTGTLLHETGAWSARRRWWLTLGGAAVVAVYALRVQDFTYEAEAWRAFLLVGGAVLWLLALPAFAGRDGDPVERMRLIDGRIVLRAIGALLYSLALFAGLALALRAVDVLFELSLDEEIYAHVWAWIFFVLAPWIVLGGLPDYVRPAGQPSAVAAVGNRIALFLVPPLLGIYYVILYAYVVRILATNELPKNLVSPLVLVAGALGVVALVLFDPPPDRRPLSRLLRLAPPLFLPLSVLGVYAVFVRLDQYGLTEFRVIRIVALAVLIALAVGATVRIVRRTRVPLHWGLVLAAAAALLIAAGPWSAIALSKRSQTDRLERALTNVGIDPHDETYRADTTAGAEPRVVPTADFEQIRGSAQYLAVNFGPDALPPALWHLARGDDARWRDYALDLGLRPDSVPADQTYAGGGMLGVGVPVRVGGGTAYRVAWYRGAGRGAPMPESGANLVLVDSTRFSLRVGERTLFADLEGVIADVPPASRRPTTLPGERAVVPLTDASGARAGDIVLWSVWAQPDSAGALRLQNLEGLAILPD